MVKAAGDRQPLGRGGAGDEAHDSLVVQKGFRTPVRGDERKETVLDFVPLAGPRREMAYGNGQPCLVSHLLQFQFP